ncbi:MAG: sugar ABC transporter substrate-binding protein [Acetobacteraceae bacterium]|nr:sugar ABC transporter substrate-binding protein [Acetobacteraceae bacterium]
MSDTERNGIGRRTLLGAAAAGVLAGGRLARAAVGGDDEIAHWTPEYVSQIAGTVEVDTAAECAKVVPLKTKGRLTYWYVGPNEASPPLDKVIDDQFWAAFGKTYPNITVERVNLDYNQVLDKLRTAAMGNAAPSCARLMLMWSPELAAKGMVRELKPEDVGYKTAEFWPGAMKSVTWEGKVYGVPTNNETMALIWNAQLFRDAGLDPETAPATWDDLVSYARQIKQKTGKAGYGLVARVNAGNTPYRFMPHAWGMGGGALDEAEDHPQYKKIYLNNDGTKAALQQSCDMYLRDQSTLRSALTNTQTENQDPFVAGQLGMMISHPVEYAVMLDKAKRATGADRAIADKVVENMRYGLIPKGTVRRAVCFGGWNFHIFDPSIVGGGLDLDAAMALATFMTGPEWSVKLAWTGSNPGNRRGFRTKWMKQRLEEIKFLNVTTSMLAGGVPFPAIPEAGEIENIIVPDMMQNALTKRMTVSKACDEAASKVRDLLSL